MKFHHPITKEKAVLKKMATIIHDLKVEIVDCGIPLIPGYCQMSKLAAREMGVLQKKLARYKRAYRHRHIAYCQVRRDMSRFPGNKGPIESKHCRRPYNKKLVQLIHKVLLTEINKAYSEYANSLLAEIEELKPCIAIFVSKYGKKKRLRIDDFEQRPNGDFVWESKGSGTVSNDLNEWPVRDNDAVWVTKAEHDKLPTELQAEPSATTGENYLMVMSFLNDYLGVVEYKPWTLNDCWTQLPVNDQVLRQFDTYNICGKKFHRSIEIEYVRDWLHIRLANNRI